MNHTIPDLVSHQGGITAPGTLVESSRSMANCQAGLSHKTDPLSASKSRYTTRVPCFK